MNNGEGWINHDTQFVGCQFIVITVHTCPSQISAYVDDNNLLTVSRTTPDAFSNQSLVIRATSNGKYVDMNVGVSGVEVVVTTNVADFEDVTLGPFTGAGGTCRFKPLPGRSLSRFDCSERP